MNIKNFEKVMSNAEKLTEKSNSNKVFWWVCASGHEWQVSPNSRIPHKGCPYCSGGRILAGYNDLLTINPIAPKWVDQKNVLLSF